MNDIIGKKFGRLTVLELHHKKQLFSKIGKKSGFAYFYLCKCDCGNLTISRIDSIKRGLTTSCGCIQREKVKISCSKTMSRHNLAKTRINNIWFNIKQRCYNKNSINFKDYGGRGITVCQEWQDDFMNFYHWAMKNGYTESMSIDRINVNGNYEPSNCRWVNMKIQENNRRNNRLICFRNKSLTLSQWAEITNIKYTTLRNRLDYGWSVEKTLTTPTRKHQ